MSTKTSDLHYFEILSHSKFKSHYWKLTKLYNMFKIFGSVDTEVSYMELSWKLKII